MSDTDKENMKEQLTEEQAREKANQLWDLLGQDHQEFKDSMIQFWTDQWLQDSSWVPTLETTLTPMIAKIVAIPR